MFTFEVDTTQYIEWVDEVKARFHNMVKTMVNVARIIELQTIPYVPLDTSALEQSYDFQYVSSSNFILLGVGYDAVDEASGFHYAEYQHEKEDLIHPKRGTDHYLVKGIMKSEDEWMQLIEKDYMSLFTGGGIVTGSIGSDNRTWNLTYPLGLRNEDI